jgi:hypothetical protein
MTSARAARGRGTARGMSARRAQVCCESVLGVGLAWATELNASTETPLERPKIAPGTGILRPETRGRNCPSFANGDRDYSEQS